MSVWYQWKWITSNFTQYLHTFGMINFKSSKALTKKVNVMTKGYLAGDLLWNLNICLCQVVMWYLGNINTLEIYLSIIKQFLTLLQAVCSARAIWLAPQLWVMYHQQEYTVYVKYFIVCLQTHFSPEIHICTTELPHYWFWYHVIC